MDKSISFAFVSTNVSLRQDWAQSISKFEQVNLVWSGSPAQAERGLLPSMKIDMILADLEELECMEFNTVRQIRKRNPRVRVMGMAYDLTSVDLSEMVAQGVHGFMRKSDRAMVLYKAIHAMVLTGYFVSQEFAQTLAYQEVTGKFNQTAQLLGELAPKEARVLELMCCDKTTQEIAYSLNLSHRTVEGYKTRIRKTLGTTSLVGAAALAVKNGWVRV